jgi:hypothetical protein
MIALLEILPEQSRVLTIKWDERGAVREATISAGPATVGGIKYTARLSREFAHNGTMQRKPSDLSGE